MTGFKLSDIVKDDCEAPYHLDFADREEDQSPSSWTKALFCKRANPLCSADAIATRRSVFDDPNLAPFYWPERDYEDIHRFNPSARWTYREEKALLRKIDWKIMVVVAIQFFALNLDSGNIVLANSGSFLSDLHLTISDYNLGDSIFRLSFLCADLPSQLISKRIGHHRWIPTQICLWSVVSLSQFWLTDRASFLTCRALLGLLQGGFIPNVMLYMSYFYTKNELPIRSSGLWMTMFFCAVVSSLMAYGIFHLDGVAGIAGWRWLFFIDALITLFVGVASFFNMAPSPTQTKTWFRPNGWFTEREEVIIVNRVLRDDPRKGNMHNLEELHPKNIWIAIYDYDLWPMYILGLVLTIPGGPASMHLTLLLRDAGFNTFDTNLLTMPSYAVKIITTFLITLVSELVNERAFVAMMENLWALPFLVALYALPSHTNPWLIFGLVTGVLSHPFIHTIQTAWCSRNSGAVGGHSASVTLYNIFSQAGLIIGSQIYVASDSPRYERGTMILIFICSINVFFLYPGTKIYYIWRNHQRAKIWDAMTSEEKEHYLETTKDVGNKRLDFRFAH